MNYQTLMNFLNSRRAIRKFEERDVPTELLEKVIEAGIAAPSGSNFQGWKVRILRDRAPIERLAQIVDDKIQVLANDWEEGLIKDELLKYSGNFSFFTEAPLMLMLYFRTKYQGASYYFGEGSSLYKGTGSLLSLGMMMQNMMLAAESLGLATCPITGPLLAAEEIDKEFPAPNKHELGAFLIMGYPQNRPQSPGRKGLKRFIIKD